MRCVIVLCIQLLFFSTAIAQVDKGSLTEEFPHLSAKQRARIAKKEAKEAVADLEFQMYMHNADSLFQLGEFNNAMAVYKSARNRRPYNVHPKVKIQDLQELIDQEEQMNGELANTETETPIVNSSLNGPPSKIETVEEIENEVQEAEMEEKPSLVVESPLADPLFEHAPVGLELPKRIPVEEKTVQQEITPVRLIRTEPSVFDIPVAADGVDKEVYREGNAVITQLTVVRDGRTNIYKKVYHQWGYVFYFKNGSAITERMWADETLTFY